MIREVRMDEYEQLMELYLHLHETSVPPAELTRPLWERRRSCGSRGWCRCWRFFTFSSHA